MTYVTEIADVVVDLSPLFPSGEPTLITSAISEVLHNALIDQTLLALHQWIKVNPKATKARIQAKARELYASAQLLPIDPIDFPHNPLGTVIRTLARDQILSRLSQLGLPVPDNLEFHTNILARNSTALRQKAESIIQARMGQPQNAAATANK